MNDFLPDSPNVARIVCPGCEAADPFSEILDLRYCDRHTPSREGAMDGHVQTLAYLSGTAEVTGEENKRWCDFFHRRS